MKKFILVNAAIFFVYWISYAQLKINRELLVKRHAVINNQFDSLSSLTVGNGSFAFTVDITGVQSFPDAYAKGVPLGTQSEWGWHSFTDTAKYAFEETLKNYTVNKRQVSYSVQLKEPLRKKNAVEWFRQNPHRLQLGNIGFDMYKKDGTIATVNDIKNIHQTLNLYTGEIHSQFTIENVPVDVITYGHQQQDAIAIKVNSPLLKEGRLQIRIRFPYPTGNWADMGNNFSNDNRHTSAIVSKKNSLAMLKHILDSTSYYVALRWSGKAGITEKHKHYFIILPQALNSFTFSCSFTAYEKAVYVPPFNAMASNSKQQWKKFWQSGAAIDFTGSTDERANELERRIILSQYLTKIQCAGNYPPQETGLTYNSWYGRPHLEMYWWHSLHFALWGRGNYLQKSLQWFKKAMPIAKKIAERQGYEGVRWQKMTDNAGNETPSSVGAFLIWQQPHFIYLAEQCYKDDNKVKVLKLYKDLVFATANFMASYAYYHTAEQKYILGPPLIPAQERFKADITINPTYELNYWHYALAIAQKWRLRLHLPKNKKWEEVINNISPLPIQNNKYLFTESSTDSYINTVYKTDHPSVLGTLGMLPKTKMVDTVIMQNTFEWIWNNWTWNETWGWDFPMTAMTATRLGMPEKAIDALMMPVETNMYLNNGHNYQDKRLPIYLPGNGGLLSAIAIMCAGYEGCKIINPGIPNNGKWKVKSEGLHKML